MNVCYVFDTVLSAVGIQMREEIPSRKLSFIKRPKAFLDH